MSDYMTFRGFVATDIKTSTTTTGVGTASFRLGSTARRFDRTTNSWVDMHTNWFTVQGYRQLAGNMGCSIKKGQRVIVVGRLKLRTWEKEGRIHFAHEIDAESVGHDLMWGSANYIRTVNNGPQLVADGGPSDPDRDGGEAGEEQEPDDDLAASEIFHEDADGNYIPVDIETGELADSAV
ncbi:single-stranded DNA-binding protein [Pseudarthrobacter sulfonivorans]|uniref:single-stranded DNA-binding protein n=1 Tax=Pseudarthrobacter sulfonivorans TaxID=121292 RepID=UPI00285C1CB8|nr:single-stranded DNA-binding protein [Pseudarthrobacter sulfonivorans]MDR6417411.1 single-strand DNA-binding protein [Pseudarthrobacter sulfonivorans]